MHNFRVPPAQCWYTTPICTPDHGVLYIAGNHSCIGYIPAANNQTGRVQMIDLRAQCVLHFYNLNCSFTLIFSLHFFPF